MVRKFIFIFLFLASLSHADIFDKGKMNFGVSVGSSSSYDTTYFLVGLSANYFVMDNVNVGLMYRSWLGSDPLQNELSFSTNYYLRINKEFRPYIGAFIRERFISGYDDITIYGARGGISFISNNTYASVGYAYETFSNCGVINECSTSYPEVVVGLSF